MARKLVVQPVAAARTMLSTATCLVAPIGVAVIVALISEQALHYVVQANNRQSL